MSIVFISDLHLTPQRSARKDLFIHLLTHYKDKIQKLYILGDLFDFWVGDDVHIPEYSQLIHHLYTFNQPVCKTFILVGNRDFLLGEQFKVKTNCQYLPDLTVIEVYYQKILLAHGDLFCTQDKMYQLYRKLVHTSLIKKLYLSFPKTLRNKIALKLRSISDQKNSKYREIDISKNYLKLLKHKGINFFIHGHTHLPGIDLISHKNTFLKRYTLSDWNTEGNILICHSKGFRLFNFDNHTNLFEGIPL